MNSKVYFTIEISGVMIGENTYKICYLTGNDDGPYWQVTKDYNEVVFETEELYDALYMFYISTKYNHYHEKKTDDESYTETINVSCDDRETNLCIFSTETCDPDEYLEFMRDLCNDLDSDE